MFGRRRYQPRGASVADGRSRRRSPRHHRDPEGGRQTPLIDSSVSSPCGCSCDGRLARVSLLVGRSRGVPSPPGTQTTRWDHAGDAVPRSNRARTRGAAGRGGGGPSSSSAGGVVARRCGVVVRFFVCVSRVGVASSCVFLCVARRCGVVMWGFCLTFVWRRRVCGVRRVCAWR